jgi:hypothetical protein
VIIRKSVEMNNHKRGLLGIEWSKVKNQDIGFCLKKRPLLLLLLLLLLILRFWDTN